MADRAAFVLTLIALVVGAVTLAAWLLLGEDLEFSLGRSITVMVITCPHALGLAIPLVVAVSTSWGAKQGLLIRERQSFEQARKVDAVVFDKTGTLTEGRFGVRKIWRLDGNQAQPADDSVGVGGFRRQEEADRRLLQLAASLEIRSEHPVAQGVARSAEQRGIELMEVTEFSSIPGKGVQGRIGDRKVKVVSPGYLEQQGIPVRQLPAGREPLTIVYVLEDERPLGAFGLTDVIREESREAIAGLHRLGIRAVMMTGDNERVAAWVARELGLDEYYAQVLPDQKARRIKELQSKGFFVAMVGDGVNDAAALVQADVGIAIGAGTDVAIESGDIVLVQNDPRSVLALFSLSRATWKKMIRNLGWATGYNVVAIPLAAGVAAAAGVILSPAVGAALMSASTMIVAINARLLRPDTRPDTR